MYCTKKGIDCPYCSLFHECQRTACCLPNTASSALGSSSYSVNVTEKSIDDIKQETLKGFVQRLKIKAIRLSAIENYHVCNLIDEVLTEYENEKC